MKKTKVEKKKVSKKVSNKKESHNDELQKYINTAKKFRITNIVIESWKDFKENFKIVMACTGLDFLFLFLFSFVTMFFQMRIFYHLTYVVEMIVDNTDGLIAEVQDPLASGMIGLMNNSDFLAHMTQITINFLYTFVVLFVLWTLIQSIGWYLLHKKVNKTKKKISYLNYLYSFSLITFACFAITLTAILLFFKYYIQVGLSTELVVGKGFVMFLYFAVLIITWYYGFYSYAKRTENPVAHFKNTFVEATKNIGKIIPAIIFLFVLYTIILNLWNLWFVVFDYYLSSIMATLISMIFGIIIFMPSMVYSKILLIKTINSK